MHLADSLPTRGRRVQPDRVLAILWLAGSAFAAFLFLLFLLHRIGLPINVVHYSFAVFFAIGISILAWLSRTITSRLFFFARKSANTASIGIGGSADWLSGSFLTLLLGLSLSSKFVLAPALVLGLLLQATLFAMTFRRANVATLAGYFDWRYENRLNNVAVLFVSTAVMAAFLVAEFSIARDVIGNLAAMTPAYASGLVLLLAAVPAVIGGWLALLIVNAVLAVTILIALLVQASLVAFLPKGIVALSAPSSASRELSALDYTTGITFGDGSVGMMFVAVLVLAAGFASQPQVFSRIATVERPIEAIRMLSFSALIVFLVMAVFPLSIGLIAATPSSKELAAALQSQKVLLMLPYIALLFAAFNGLAVTLMTMASSIIRGIRRSTKRDPGEQSVFATRGLTIIICILLFSFVAEQKIDAGHWLLGTLATGAAGLFVPLFAAVWLSKIPSWASSMACVGGASLTGYVLYAGMVSSTTDAALYGMAVSTACLFAGRLYVALSRREFHDPKLLSLRVPDNTL